MYFHLSSAAGRQGAGVRALRLGWGRRRAASEPRHLKLAMAVISPRGTFKFRPVAGPAAVNDSGATLKSLVMLAVGIGI